MEATMNDSEIRERARAHLRDGTLPRYPPMVQPGQQDVASAAMVRDKPCSVCGETGSRITLRYAIGVFYFHSPCYRIWDEERSRRARKGSRTARDQANTAVQMTVGARKVAGQARERVSRVATVLGRVARVSSRKVAALAGALRRETGKASAAASAKPKTK